MAPAYTPPGSRTTAAILALYVKVGACVLAIGADVGRVFAARGLAEGRLLVDDLLEADRLVLFGALVEAAALVVALVFVLRWWLVVRRNGAVLGEGPRVPWWWVVAVAVAVVAVALSWTVLGEAEDVADRQRIDLLRAGGTALSALATALTIVVVAGVTRRQEQRAAELGLPRREPVPERDEPADEGGLRVVSEAEARRSEPDA